MIEFSLHKKLKAAEGEMLLEVNYQLQEGQFLSIYGPSGAGKTSILRMLAGLMTPDDGSIRVKDTIWFDRQSKINLVPQKRKTGYVFQDYALFPNMTVRQNLCYALEKNQSQNFVDELMDIIELSQLQHRRPQTLSGGQQQRVALARALVRKPDILLLDEPLSALDHDMRIKLQDYILKVHRHYQLSIILVSHDLAEVYKMSDQIILLDQGKVLKTGTPAAVFAADNKGDDGLTIPGEIIGIETTNTNTTFTILIGKKMICIYPSQEQIDAYQIGDKILVQVDLAHLAIVGIKN